MFNRADTLIIIISHKDETVRAIEYGDNEHMLWGKDIGKENKGYGLTMWEAIRSLAAKKIAQERHRE